LRFTGLQYTRDDSVPPHTSALDLSHLLELLGRENGMKIDVSPKISGSSTVNFEAVTSDSSRVPGSLQEENQRQRLAAAPVQFRLPILGRLLGTETKRDKRQKLVVLETPNTQAPAQAAGAAVVDAQVDKKAQTPHPMVYPTALIEAKPARAPKRDPQVQHASDDRPVDRARDGGAATQVVPNVGQESHALDPSPPLGGCAVHVVQAHETLRGTARARLGDPRRFQEIASLNQDLLTEGRISSGMRLLLPDDARLASPRGN
jgi:hypothetical protein